MKQNKNSALISNRAKGDSNIILTTPPANPYRETPTSIISQLSCRPAIPPQPRHPPHPSIAHNPPFTVNVVPFKRFSVPHHQITQNPCQLRCWRGSPRIDSPPDRSQNRNQLFDKRLGSGGNERSEGGLGRCVDEAEAEDKGTEGGIGGREREEGRFRTGFYWGKSGAESPGLVGGLDWGWVLNRVANVGRERESYAFA